MNLLKLSDFTVRPYKFNNTPEQKDLPDFIDAEHVKMVKKILGITLYDAFNSGLAAGSIETKWSDLRDGKNYDYNGYTYRWEGMVNLLRPYIWAMWIRTTFLQKTAAGITIPTPRHTTVVDPTDEIVKAYNDFYIQLGNSKNLKNTLYGFLYVNEDTYEDWVFDDPKGMNSFGL